MHLPKENIRYLIVHQTATPRDTTTFESIKKFHLRLGWGNIAYHYFITADGRIRKGRSERTVGTHTKADKMSLRSLGIGLAGEFDTEEPTKVQLASLERKLKELIAKYKIPAGNVLGHLEVPGAATKCPGDNLLGWIQEFREKITGSSISRGS